MGERDRSIRMGERMGGGVSREIRGGIEGLLVVDKPRGLTSRAVVDRVAGLVGRVKVGHAGTLDPLASGVLVVCVGAATRLVEEVQRLPKSYRTVVLLGARSDTLDADGRIEHLDGSAPAVAGRGRGGGGPAGGRGGPGAAGVLGPEGQGPARLRPGAGRAGGRAGPAPGPDRPDRGARLRLAPPGAGDRLRRQGPTSARSRATSARRWAAAGWWRSWSGPGSGRSRSRMRWTSPGSRPSRCPGWIRPAVEAVAGLPRLVLDPDQVGRRGRAGGSPPPSSARPRSRPARSPWSTPTAGSSPWPKPTRPEDASSRARCSSVNEFRTVRAICLAGRAAAGPNLDGARPCRV